MEETQPNKRPTDPKLTPKMVEESGLQRCRALVATYGITSPQVLACVERWGRILDDVSRETTEDK